MRENSHVRRAGVIQELLANFVSVPESRLRAFASKLAAITPSLTPGDLKSLTYKVLAHESFSHILASKVNKTARALQIHGV